MRIFIRICLLLVLALATQSWLASCEREEPPDLEAFGVTGRVIDSLTLAPIDSAVLSLDDTTGGGGVAFSDSVGNYAFPSSSATFTLYVQKEGYRIQSREFRNITSDQSGIDFRLAIQSKANERR